MLSLFADDVTLYVEKSRDNKQKQYQKLQRIKLQDTKPTHKNQPHFSVKSRLYVKEIKHNSKRIK